MSKVKEAVRAVHDAAREMSEVGSDEYERVRKEHEEAVDALIAAVRAEKRKLAEMLGTLVHLTQDHEKAKALLEEYTQAVLDNFRAKGLTCPWCERRIDEWPLPE